MNELGASDDAQKAHAQGSPTASRVHGRDPYPILHLYYRFKCKLHVFDRGREEGHLRRYDEMKDTPLSRMAPPVSGNGSGNFTTLLIKSATIHDRGAALEPVEQELKTQGLSPERIQSLLETAENALNSWSHAEGPAGVGSGDTLP